jgi:transposase InsO family protein/transposase-like protein
MHNQSSSKRIPARGKRYSPALLQEMLRFAAEHGPTATMQKYGCSAWSIYRWQRQARRAAGTTPEAISAPDRRAVCDTPLPDRAFKPDTAKAVAPLAPRQAAPVGDQTSSLTSAHFPGEVSLENNGAQKTTDAPLQGDEHHQRILNTWKQHPLLGPSQIKNQLRRLGYKMSVNTVRNVMEEHGYVTPKIQRKEHTGSYEAVRPRQLYHLDFYHLHVHKQKQVLLLIEDDFSRFIAGWTLVENENAEAVIEAFEKAVMRYGKPEAVMSDRGSAFYSWSGVSRFENLLVEYGIDYLVAREPQTNGKVEALNATVQRELIRKIEFVDLADAARQIDHWVRYYNCERTHHALGGILVPADRFFGCVEEMMARIQAGQGGSPLDLLAGADRVLELFRIIARDGTPEIYLLGKKIFG